MRHLINREEYINEYLRIHNTENDNKLYESLLSAVFGGLKMLFKKDWENIRCKNPSVLEYLKEVDKSLSGYTMVKMEFSSECNNIRQNVADYYNDILEYKLLQLEKEDNAEKFLEKQKMDSENDEKNEDRVDAVGKVLNIKDKTLLDSLKKYVDNIKTNSSKSPKLKEYADQMLNAVIVTVNDIILKELEKKGVDKAKLEEKREKLEQERKHLEEVRKKMDEEAKKAGEKALKELNKKRDDAMRKIGINPIGDMDGSKSIDMIVKQFGDMLKEFNNQKVNESALPNGYENVFKSDTYIGIQKSLEDLKMEFNGEENTDDEVYNKFIIKVILNKVNTVFKVISKNKDLFKGVPSASVQAMMVSLTNAIIYGFVGGEKFNIEKDNARLSLMTKCVIDSDATIGFNLPLIDPKKPDNGNFFVSIMNQFKNTDISSKETEEVLKSMNKKDLDVLSKKIDDGSSDSDVELDNSSEIAKYFGSEIMKNFRQNMSKLFDIIVKKAKKIKDKAEKDREAKAAKLNNKK
jgi:inhibitor of KinA sporulation pathway (predicted exonuclease)